ncbi:MAG: hypothetical protein PHH31_01940 [Acidaminococcaceae bacterium]|nr:hypothetical protein [Acidaminococcaceae bacterium]MDD4722530.1 hypothetical protein [Acidaminococcaceae bacterium]
MVKKLMLMWKNYTGNNRINISGEILLSNKDSTKLLILTNDEQERIRELHCKLINEFPYLKTKMTQSMCEVSIKIFAYNVFTNNKEFLNNLCTTMEYMIKKLLENPEVNVRLNIFGDFTTTKLKQKFRYLNKQDVVEYNITHEENLSVAYYVFTRGLKVYLLLLIVLALFARSGYLYYMETCPNVVSEFFAKYIHLSQSI